MGLLTQLVRPFWLKDTLKLGPLWEQLFSWASTLHLEYLAGITLRIHNTTKIRLLQGNGMAAISKKNCWYNPMSNYYNIDVINKMKCICIPCCVLSKLTLIRLNLRGTLLVIGVLDLLCVSLSWLEIDFLNQWKCFLRLVYTTCRDLFNSGA